MSTFGADPRQRRGAAKQRATRIAYRENKLKLRLLKITEECWYIFEDSHDFDNAPYFNRNDDKFNFDTNGVDNANDNYGSVFLAR